MHLPPILLSLSVAACATAVVLPPAVLTGFALARWRSRVKPLVATIVLLPLVLPPTAVGYLLLSLLGREGRLGPRTLGFDPDLLFTWKGACLAAAVMSFPVVAGTARAAFERVSTRLEAMGRTLGYSPYAVFLRITLPLARRGLAAAAVLGFGRALGEFGATVLVAGNIPGRTQTAAVAIFDAIQVGDDRGVALLLVSMAALALALVGGAELLLRPPQRPEPGPEAP
ncbi:MAG: molybdate ABC transporter permease subunit [Planctomycetes bacterium]|nr:molybdate ABC transporter permease subunit [Planctomycetota bacterium]